MGLISHLFNYVSLFTGSLITRTASCVWLLCMVKYAGNHPTVQEMLKPIQAAFSQALTESQQFMQEVAAKGNTQRYFSFYLFLNLFA